MKRNAILKQRELGKLLILPTSSVACILFCSRSRATRNT